MRISWNGQLWRTIYCVSGCCKACPANVKHRSQFIHSISSRITVARCDSGHDQTFSDVSILCRCDSDDDDNNDSGAEESLRRSRRRTVRHKKSKIIRCCAHSGSDCLWSRAGAVRAVTWCSCRWTIYKEVQHDMHIPDYREIRRQCWPTHIMMTHFLMRCFADLIETPVTS